MVSQRQIRDLTYISEFTSNIVHIPEDDSGFSPAEAVYDSTLSLPGKFLEHSELTLESFLRRDEQAVLGFYRPLRHHVVPQPKPQPLPRALLDAEFLFIQDDALKLPLSPLYENKFLREPIHFLV